MDVKKDAETGEVTMVMSAEEFQAFRSALVSAWNIVRGVVSQAIKATEAK